MLGMTYKNTSIYHYFNKAGFAFGLMAIMMMASSFVYAQDMPLNSNVQSARPLQDDGMIDVGDMEKRPVVRLRIMDKITAITHTYNISVGDITAFGDLRLRPRACYKAPPIAEPESSAFLEIWENVRAPESLEKQGDKTLTHDEVVSAIREEKPRWIFSGWMFASSPALSAMDHPVYDVWIIGCLTTEEAKAAIENDARATSKEEDASKSESKIGSSQEQMDASDLSGDDDAEAAIED
jgi:hypothetical protein